MTSRVPPATNQWRRENNWVFDEEVAFQKRFEDSISGLPIYQLTNEPVVSTNIYPEAPISTHDGKYFVFSRRLPLSSQPQYWIADTETHWIRQVTDEKNATPPIYNPKDGCFYYLDGNHLNRIFTEDFSRELIYKLDSSVHPTHGALIPVGGLRAFNQTGKFTTFTARFNNQQTVTVVMDIERQEIIFVYDNPEALNPHPQISQNNHPKLLLQVNNGIRYDQEGNLLSLVGNNGASLIVSELNGSNQVQLNIGFSIHERIQGHQCWVGKDNKVITTMHRRERPNTHWVQDRIATILPDDNRPKVISEGPGFTHIHTDPEGQYWISDCNKTGDIYIGSLGTGKFKLLCESKSSFGNAQETHPHPFFIGSKSKVGWNSDCSGIPQIYFTSIHDSFFDSLL